MGSARARAAIDRFRIACERHPLVLAAFLGGSYAAGTAREDSDIDLYLITAAADYPAFVTGRHGFMEAWGPPVWMHEVWDFEGLGFDMVLFELADGVRGELALGHDRNFRALHGGPHVVLVDPTSFLEGVEFPLL
jgi:predicted nucleotidyltransferase